MAERAIEVQEKPILFSGAMVRAVIEGRKTQTRRVAKLICELADKHESVRVRTNGDKVNVSRQAMHTPTVREHFETACPYGKPGDRLWVRETWCIGGNPTRVCYRASEGSDADYWKPSIHMPRAYSRLTVEIVSVKVERVQEISEADAIAEGAAMLDSGLECSQCSWTGYEDSNGVQLVEIGNEDSEFHCPECQEVCAHHPIDEQCRWGFHRLWDSINAKRDGGKYAWEKNPFVWAIQFKAVK